MENFIINPANYEQDYIKNLNICFGNWGGEKEYEWGLERKVGEHSTDIMLIENEEDGIIAGSAVSYRELRSKKNSLKIGIMTGSWTLPTARRKGCFTKIINCSKSLSNDNNVSFLTAFVTKTNASSRRLESAGSYMIPTFHLFSPQDKYKDEGQNEAEVLEANEENHRQIFERFQETQGNFLRFHYSPAEFQSQYLNRIKITTILKINEDYAILEDGKNEVKILLLTHKNIEDFENYIKTVSNWCLKNKGQKSFLFTTRKEIADLCIRLEFENIPGYYTILNTMKDSVNIEEKFRNLDINMADKM